ncbi:MAG: class I SAM-dependent methyltransferase [Planctomycetota bacterium]
MTHQHSPPETRYTREPGYAERYRDQRFRRASGPRTHEREVAAVRALLARAGRPAPGPWLDLPSGAGRLSHLLPQPVVRADRDATMLQACDGDARRVCAAAAALPFADGTFAGALCMRLMQHIPTPTERLAILRELRRVTAGPVLVSFFHSYSLQHARRALRRCVRGQRSGRGAISARRFAAELREAGLEARATMALCRWVSEQWIVLAIPL